MAPLMRCGRLLALAAGAAAAADAAGEGGSAVAGASPAANVPQLRATAGRRLLSANETALALEQGLFYPDATDGMCQLGYNCSASNIPTSRGVCVVTNTGNQCWDVCNPEHTPQEYEVGTDASTNAAFAGLVASVRQGLNSYVQCPGALGMGDECPPGSLCKGHMLFKHKVPEGRGMCVVDESEPNGRACWDMCSGEHDPEDFAVGTAYGTINKVWQTRQNGGCPSSSWWPWILVAVVGVLLLTCFVWVFILLFKMGRKRTRGLSLERPTSRQELVEAEEEYKEPAPPPVMEDQRLDSSEYGARGYSNREDYRIPEPPPMEMGQDGMPPEPPREMPYHQMRELPPPPMDPQMQLFDQIDSNHDGQITREEYERFFPGSTQARIPGLDEPNLLFSNIQPLIVPQTTAQVAPPELLSQAVPRNMFLNPDPLGGSQPQVVAPFFAAASSQPAFQLQPAFSTQPPLTGSAPSSLQMRPGALSPAPAGQPFFTQLARR